MVTTAITIEDQELTKFAESVYEEHKADFVKGLAARIKNSIDTGMAQCDKGECMSFDDFKEKFNKEHAFDERKHQNS